MKLDIDIFRFDSRVDYNEYYQSLEVHIDDNLSLKDLLEQVSKMINDFSYDALSFGFRINNVVIFSNVKLCDLKNRFGTKLVFSPISTKYAKKDLLIDKDSVFAQYKPILDRFAFLSEESKLEFKKYILINLISPLDFEDYIGDGYCLYIKWMMIHYKDNADELLESISCCNNGIMNSISLKYMIYPVDNSIDNDIAGLQKMFLGKQKNRSNRHYCNKLIKDLELSYKKICKQGRYNG